MSRHFEREGGGSAMITRGRVLDAMVACALVASVGETPVGLLSYVRTGPECEILSLDAFERGRGIGTRLVEYLLARSAAQTSVVVVTTNDNLAALGFYQRLGFRLTEIRADAVTRARRHKPSIPIIGETGIPIRDELVLTRGTTGGDHRPVSGPIDFP